MMSKTTAIYELNVVADDPRFEGFALEPAPSLLGRDSLDDDLTPGFADAEETALWQQPKLAELWKPPAVQGRLADFNDYPGVDLVLPAFSERAVNALRDFLEPNGEILSLAAKTKTNYFFYNILTVSSALNVPASKCEFWCDPPTTATQIDFFDFDSDKLQGLSIFRIHQLPMSVFVTNRFVDRVEFFGLNGFSFTKIWPLKASVNWRRQEPKEDLQRRKALKRHTVVVNIPFTGESQEALRIAAFEDSVDEMLRPASLSSEYFGSYEGHERLGEEYRMFFSCPDADRLFKFLSEAIESMEWPSEIVVCRRYGRMYDADASEKVNTI